MKILFPLREQRLELFTRLLLLLLVLGTLPSCSKTKAEATASAVVETNTDPSVFKLRDAGQFPLTVVEIRKVSDEVHLNGIIAPDINRSVPIVSLGGGRVV